MVVQYWWWRCLIVYIHVPIVSIHKLIILVSNDHIIRWQLSQLEHSNTIAFNWFFNISGAILFHINKLRDNLLVRSLSKSPNTNILGGAP